MPGLSQGFSPPGGLGHRRRQCCSFLSCGVSGMKNWVAARAQSLVVELRGAALGWPKRASSSWQSERGTVSTPAYRRGRQGPHASLSSTAVTVRGCHRASPPSAAEKRTLPPGTASPFRLCGAPCPGRVAGPRTRPLSTCLQCRPAPRRGLSGLHRTQRVRVSGEPPSGTILHFPRRPSYLGPSV